MESLLILVFGIITVLTLIYFLLIGLCNLLKKLVEGSRESLKGIFVLIGLICVSYVLFNHDRADEIIEEIRAYTLDKRLTQSQENMDKPTLYLRR